MRIVLAIVGVGAQCKTVRQSLSFAETQVRVVSKSPPRQSDEVHVGVRNEPSPASAVEAVSVAQVRADRRRRSES